MEVDRMLYNGENPILQITDVAHIRFPGGSFTVPPRAYSSMTFRISGNAAITCGSTECHVQANDILYLPQGLGYTAEYTDTEMIAIHFVTALDDSAAEVYTFENSEQLYKLFLQARSLWEQKEPGYPVYLLAQLYTILGTVLEKETKTGLPRHFLNAISFINANYKNNSLGIQQICAEAGIGATAFRQLFAKHYQKTPTQYILELRLSYARNLISGGMPIEAAAWESGFNDPKYFARVVKKHFGCTPRDLKTYGK